MQRDYECYAWDTVGKGTLPYDDAALCDYASWVPCDYWSFFGLSCADLGDATNSTNMSGRDPVTGKKRHLVVTPIRRYAFGHR